MPDINQQNLEISGERVLGRIPSSNIKDENREGFLLVVLDHCNTFIRQRGTCKIMSEQDP